jgi:protein-tyrosine phosphatase
MSTWFINYGYEQVYPDLFVGAYPLDRTDVALLADLGVDRVLNLVEDGEYPPEARAEIESAYDRAGIREQRMNLVDFGRLPADRIEEAVGILLNWLEQDQRVYVHCRAGWQRSAAVASGAVAIRERISIADALALVQARKPTANPLPHQRADLAVWWADRRGRQRGGDSR